MNYKLICHKDKKLVRTVLMRGQRTMKISMAYVLSVIIVCFCLCMPACVFAGSLENGNTIKEHWAEPCISHLIEQGILVEKNDFLNPESSVSLGEFCGILDRLCGVNDKVYEQRSITRAEAAVMLSKALNIIEIPEIEHFLDHEDIPKWAQDAVYGVYNLELMGKTSDNCFRPNDFLTKGEYAVILERLITYQFLRTDYISVLDEAKLSMTKFELSSSAIEDIEDAIRSCGKGVSVYYQDIESGYAYSYNEHQKYFIASLIKAPYCMYIFTLASQGQCDLGKSYQYLSRHSAGGTGKMRYMKKGGYFTMKELISYAIKYSDNVALNMIKEQYPPSGYRVFAKGLGLHYPNDIKNATNGSITAIDAGIYMNAIYHFIQTNPYGSELRELMLSTDTPMIVSQYPVVRKYGWAGDDFHDMAIIEAPRPYILCICTSRDGNFDIFKKISAVMEKHAITGE